MDELEAKYLLTGGPNKRDKSLRRLLQELFWAGYAVVPKDTIRIRDIYFDTPDWHLQRAGWSLRSRSGEGCTVITSKQIGVSRTGMFERLEIEQSLFDGEWNINQLGAGDVTELLKTL
ncbi:MAG: CYTH domain-containing protein, partial [Pseudomonadales bacterium]